MVRAPALTEPPVALAGGEKRAALSPADRGIRGKAPYLDSPFMQSIKGELSHRPRTKCAGGGTEGVHLICTTPTVNGIKPLPPPPLSPLD